MKKIASFLAIVLIFCSIFITPVYADDLNVQINIYQNDIYVGNIYVDAMCGEDLNIGSLNEVYGTPNKATVTINGAAGIVFTWALPDFISYTDSSYGCPEPGAAVVVNIYYTKEVVIEEPVEEEVVYGNITLDIATLYPADPYETNSVVITGTKGVDNISNTYSFNSDGKLSIDVDTSYSWSFIFRDATYNIDSFPFYTQLSVPENAPEPVINEEEVAAEHTVFITWEYSKNPGGTMVDGHSDDSFIFSNTSFKATAGDILNLKEYVTNPPGGTLLEDGDKGTLIQIENNVYQLGAIYKAGGNPNSKWPLHSDAPLEATPMVNDDLKVTFHYFWVYTEPEVIEKEVEKVVEVEKIVEKPVTVTVPVPVPVEKVVTIKTEVPVEKVVTVQTEVPVEKIVTVPTTEAETSTSSVITTTIIPDSEVPLAETRAVKEEKGWSLLSAMLLIMTGTALLNLPDKKKKYNIFNFIPILFAIIVFFVLEKMNGTMVWIDDTTLFMFVFYISEVITRLYADNKEEDEDKEEEVTEI